MAHDTKSIGIPGQVFGGFLAGFISTITFHQVTLWVLWQIGFAPFAPYIFTAVAPLGIPAVVSLACWGGLWGVVFAITQKGFPRNAYWASAFVFGAILPSLVALLIVLPLKGKPMGGGWHWPLLVTAFLINGAWGFGTAAIFQLLASKAKKAEPEAVKCIAEVSCDR